MEELKRMIMTHKHIIGSVFGLLTLMAFPGCTSNQIDYPEETNGTLMAVKPQIQFADTRTTYSDAASGNFAWETGDQIKIVYNINEGGVGSYDRIMGTLTPISGSEHIARISGITESDIHAGYPCVAFFAPMYFDPTPGVDVYCNSEYVSVAGPTVPKVSSSNYVLDISSNLYSNSCPIWMVAKYNHSTKQFVFEHESWGMLRFICNNVPVNTNYLSVEIDEANVYGSYGFTYFSHKVDFVFGNPGSFRLRLDNFDDVPVKFLLFQDNSGLSWLTSGIKLNLPLFAETGTYYKDFTIKAHASDNSVIDSKTIATTAQIDPGEGYKYTVNFGPTITYPLTITFGGGTKTSGSATRTEVTDQNSYSYYRYTLSDFLSAANQQYLSSVYSSQSNNISLTCNSGYLQINDPSTSSTSPGKNLILQFSTPITAKRIDITLFSPNNNKKIRLRYNDNSHTLGNEKTIPYRSSSTLSWSGSSGGLSSAITMNDLRIAVTGTTNIESITIYDN